MQKMLLIDQEKCTGCRFCEAACSAKHEGASNPSRSRVHVIKWEWQGFMVPFMCLQCQDAPCMAVCPVNALSRDQEFGRVNVDYGRCLGCKLCIQACPFGGMGFDPVDMKVIKCDFCDGDPACVKFCETGAIRFVDVSSASLEKKRAAIVNLPERMKTFEVY